MILLLLVHMSLETYISFIDLIQWSKVFLHNSFCKLDGQLDDEDMQDTMYCMHF